MLYACPHCHGKLITEPTHIVCANCNAGFPVLENIPVFCDPDAFYEGRWVEPDESAGSLRNWLVKKQRFFVRRLARAEGPVLDLGCGGGWRLFASSREAVGIDVSRASLAAARKIYSHVAAADLKELPFPDETFALVVSSDVLGHVPLEAKDRVLSEIYRVLQKGGRTLHYVEAEGQDPLSRFDKLYPQLYQKHVIDPEGHVGLEKSTEVTARFRSHGFVPVREVPCYKVLMYVNRVVQKYDNDYKKSSKLLSASVAVCRALTRSTMTENLANLAMSLAIEIVDRLLPPDWSSGVLVEYRK